MRKISVVLVAILVLLSGCSALFGGEGTVSPEPAQPTVSGTPIPSPSPTQATDANQTIQSLESIVLNRRDLSADYVRIGQVQQASPNQSADTVNDSVEEWYRHTFRQNTSASGPLLISSEVRKYDSATAARSALQRRSTGPERLNFTSNRVQVSSDIEIVLVQFRPDSGTYGVTAMYQTGAVVLTVQTFDPMQYHDQLARSLLLKMIGYAQ